MVCTILNQIFYKHNKFDNQDDLHILEPYTLNQNFIQNNSHNNNEIIHNNNNENMNISSNKLESESESESKHKLFTPRKEDTLFWSTYVLHFGEAEYTMIGGKYKNKELQEKQNILAYIQKNGSSIKTCAQTNQVKISNVRMQEIAAEMMINKKTSWYVFYVMCMYYKFNAIILQNEIYIKFMVDLEYDTFLFERSNDGFFSVDVESISKVRQEDIESTCLKIDPFLPKILKGVSTYKTIELEEIGKKLGIILDIPKPKKTDWYDVIINKLVGMLIL